MSCVITGVGTALPPHRMIQAEAARLNQAYGGRHGGARRLLPALYRRTGVEHREQQPVVAARCGGH